MRVRLTALALAMVTPAILPAGPLTIGGTDINNPNSQVSFIGDTTGGTLILGDCAASTCTIDGSGVISSPALSLTWSFITVLSVSNNLTYAPTPGNPPFSVSMNGATTTFDLTDTLGDSAAGSVVWTDLSDDPTNGTDVNGGLTLTAVGASPSNAFQTYFNSPAIGKYYGVTLDVVCVDVNGAQTACIPAPSESLAGPPSDPAGPLNNSTLSPAPEPGTLFAAGGALVGLFLKQRYFRTPTLSASSRK